MLPPGHLALGYLTAYGLTHLFPSALSPDEINILLASGALLGALPDADFVPFFARRKSLRLTADEDTHRSYATHAPLIWLILGLIIACTAPDPFIRLLGLLVWLAPWSHFLGDSLEYGVRWLWPFSSRYFSLLGRSPHRDTAVSCAEEKDLFSHYWCVIRNYIKESPVFWLEALSIFAALAVFSLNGY